MAKVKINTTNFDTGRFTKNLESFLNYSENSFFLEDILGHAIRNLYLLLPNGKENYKKNDPKIGHVWLAVDFEGDYHSIALSYSPSSYYQDRFGYLNCQIGSINLKKKTYKVVWGHEKDCFKTIDSDEWLTKNHQLPVLLMKDTQKVMSYLGLRKERTPS